MSIKAKSCFEFTLHDFSKLPYKVYSPPFATAFDTFWQLKFKPISSEHPDHCSVYLVALPNQEEANTTSTWTNRAIYTAYVYIKNPRTFLEIKKSKLDMSKFTAIKPLRGRNRFCKKSLLQYDELILGVEFDTTEFESSDSKPSFPGNGKSFPSDLIEAWGDQLNNVETADVEFRVQGHPIYANAAILSKRSEYFKRMFEGKLIESLTYNNKDLRKRQRLQAQLQSQPSISLQQSQSSTSQGSLPSSYASSSSTLAQLLYPPYNLTLQKQELLDTDIISHLPHKRKRLGQTDDRTTIDGNENIVNDAPLSELTVARKPSERIIINVTDFHPDTFLEMLHYLYTNQVTFGANNSHRSPVDMYKIADKYLIENLQQIAKVKLCKGININNAAEFLFGTAWQYEELKEHVMNYVVQNFRSVCKTKGFKNITANPIEYPYFHDLITEILSEVFSDGDSEYSDS